jgi:hypothetical protein
MEWPNCRECATTLIDWKCGGNVRCSLSGEIQRDLKQLSIELWGYDATVLTEKQLLSLAADIFTRLAGTVDRLPIASRGRSPSALLFIEIHAEREGRMADIQIPPALLELCITHLSQFADLDGLITGRQFQMMLPIIRESNLESVQKTVAELRGHEEIRITALGGGEEEE